MGGWGGEHAFEAPFCLKHHLFPKHQFCSKHHVCSIVSHAYWHFWFFIFFIYFCLPPSPGSNLPVGRSEPDWIKIQKTPLFILFSGSISGKSEPNFEINRSQVLKSEPTFRLGGGWGVLPHTSKILNRHISETVRATLLKFCVVNLITNWSSISQ